MKYFIDIHHASLIKAGEELCGDQVRTLRSGDKTRVVLSDGLGSGVKANILASLTSEIMINMLREDASLADVIETMAGTLPVCKERNIAYATFTVIEVDHSSLKYRLYNFDNPPVLYFHKGKLKSLPYRQEIILDRKILICEGQLQQGDFFAMLSDGVAHAGPGISFNMNWTSTNIARFIEDFFLYHPSGAKSIVDKTLARTRELYQGKPGDDATMIGLFVRPSQAAIVFTGPPVDEAEDEALANRVLNFEGRRIVCGGTTGKIVATFAGQVVHTDVSTMSQDIPPIGFLPGVDLLTEGILTMTGALEWLEKTCGNVSLLPQENNGAVMLARALLLSDEITFLVGQKVNPYYQNPLLPASVSIRKNLVEKMAACLVRLHKSVQVELH